MKYCKETLYEYTWILYKIIPIEKREKGISSGNVQ